MRPTIKHWIERHYVILSLFALAVVIILAAFLWHSIDDLAVVLTLLGGIVSFVFIFQRYQLEEVKAFREVFAEFNGRYDRVNERLNAIARKRQGQPLTKKDRDLLNDYFNLCGEEYFYFRRGLIYPEVWQAWAAGIHYFLTRPLIQPIWRAEEASDSYYGLTIDALRSTLQKPGRNRSRRAPPAA